MLIRISILWHQLQLADGLLVDGEIDRLSDRVFTYFWFWTSVLTVLSGG